MREQSELGVISGLRGSSITGWGRVFAWDSGLAGDSRLLSESKEHISTTECSTQRRTPRFKTFENVTIRTKNASPVNPKIGRPVRMQWRKCTYPLIKSTAMHYNE